MNVLPVERNLCGPSLLSETPLASLPSGAEGCTLHVGLPASGGPEERLWKAHRLFLLTFSSGSSLAPWNLAVLIVLP